MGVTIARQLLKVLLASFQLFLMLTSNFTQLLDDLDVVGAMERSRSKNLRLHDGKPKQHVGDLQNVDRRDDPSEKEERQKRKVMVMSYGHVGDHATQEILACQKSAM